MLARGLVVVEVNGGQSSAPGGTDQPVVRVWRVDSKSAELPAPDLHVYWETAPDRPEGHWMIPPGSAGQARWLSIEEHNGYDVPQSFTDESGLRIARDGSWLYEDWSQVILVVLPPLCDVRKATPSPRAKLKADRLTLWFERSPGSRESQTWTAAWEPTAASDLAELRRTESELNARFCEYQRQTPTHSHVALQGTAQGRPDVAEKTLIWTKRGAILTGLGIVVAAIVAIVIAVLTSQDTSVRTGPAGVAVNVVPHDPIGGAAIYPVPGGRPSEFVAAGMSFYIDCLQRVLPNHLLARISDAFDKNHWIDVFDVRTPEGQDVRFLRPGLPSCGPPVRVAPAG